MEAGSKSATASFTEGDLSRHLMRLSGYMILGFLAMTLASFVETVYLGRVGTEAIAAVTFAFPVLMAIGAATRDPRHRRRDRRRSRAGHWGRGSRACGLPHHPWPVARAGLQHPLLGARVGLRTTVVPPDGRP